MSKRPSLAVAPVSLLAEPDLSPAHKRAIEGALRWAWAQLAVANPKVLRNGTEEEVTYALQEILNDRENGHRRAPGLGDFENVTRGESQKTSDGRLKKMPDLTFRPPVYPPVTNTTHWGCFVEAKLIGGAATVGLYCENGVQRFANGEYAARMQSGMMLAYVRDGRKPIAALKSRLPLYGADVLSPRTTDDACLSNHQRSALQPRACVEIELLHLWLQVLT